MLIHRAGDPAVVLTCTCAPSARRPQTSLEPRLNRRRHGVGYRCNFRSGSRNRTEAVDDETTHVGEPSPDNIQRQERVRSDAVHATDTIVRHIRGGGSDCCTNARL